MSEKMKQTGSGLGGIREQIDATDREMLDLLSRRAGLVTQVAQAKALSDDRRVIRPAREVAQMRAFLSWYKAQHMAMPVTGFLAVWREIISASICQQIDLQVATVAQTAVAARGQFGSAATYQQFDTPADALAGMDIAAQHIAVLPVADDNWWADLPDGLVAFAALPLLGDEITAICVGAVELEETGDDITLVSCTAAQLPDNGRVIASYGAQRLVALTGFLRDMDSSLKPVGTIGLIGHN